MKRSISPKKAAFLNAVLFLTLALPGWNIGSGLVSPDILLEGVVVARNPDLSVAVLRAARSGEAVILGIGEEISGFTLVRVFHSRVILNKHGIIYEIYLNGGGPARVDLESENKAAQSKTRTNIIPQPAPPVVMEFTRTEMEDRLQKEWSRIMKETRFTPHIKDGLIQGFRLDKVPEHSLLSDVGLKPGDIVMEINGILLDSLASVMGLYQKFRNTNHLQVRLERDRKVLTLQYILK